MGLHSYDNDPYRYGYQLELNASVTEKLTRKTYSGKITVKLYRSAVALKFADSNPKAYKTGFPFQALVRSMIFFRGLLIFMVKTTLNCL